LAIDRQSRIAADDKVTRAVDRQGLGFGKAQREPWSVTIMHALDGFLVDLRREDQYLHPSLAKQLPADRTSRGEDQGHG
jgi:hypothetical protein